MLGPLRWKHLDEIACEHAKRLPSRSCIVCVVADEDIAHPDLKSGRGVIGRTGMLHDFAPLTFHDALPTRHGLTHDG